MTQNKLNTDELSEALKVVLSQRLQLQEAIQDIETNDPPQGLTKLEWLGKCLKEFAIKDSHLQEINRKLQEMRKTHEDQTK